MIKVNALLFAILHNLDLGNVAGLGLLQGRFVLINKVTLDFFFKACLLFIGVRGQSHFFAG